MKHWYRALPFKVICFILSIVFLAITVACGFGVWLMIEEQFYTLPEEYVIESNIKSMLLSDSNNILFRHLDITDYYYHYDDFDYSEGTSNIRYNVISPDGELIGSNSDLEEFTYSFRILFYFDENNNLQEFEYLYSADTPEDGLVYTVNISLDENLPVHDKYAVAIDLIKLCYSLRYAVYFIALISLALSISCFIILMCTAGRTPRNDELHKGPFYKIPIDLLICSLTLIYYVIFYCIWDIWYLGDVFGTILTVIMIIACVYSFIGICVSISARIKGQTLLKNTLIWIILKGIGRIIKKTATGIAKLISLIPMIWRTVLFVTANTIIDFSLLIMAFNWDGGCFFIWTVKTLMLLPLIIYTVITLRKLEIGGISISKGDFSYKINTKGMLWNFKKHGENLNNISDALNIAVEERTKSERLKTELITNVSHDIKTPITSIINYSSLIADESCNCDNHKQYSNVLIRKSEHLIRLLDDLVEVSKATTGNLDISLSKCDGTIFISQIAGEFEDRCINANLELICNYPDAPVWIMADPRRLWRIFDNILSNACKYSLEGSRIYLNLEKSDGFAVFTLRNTSKTALNIPAEELTQRFVRGDSSRTTEGSGLGLSIAESLTQLQRGEMNITIDGDLFKVTIKFPSN